MLHNRQIVTRRSNSITLRKRTHAFGVVLKEDYRPFLCQKRKGKEKPEQKLVRAGGATENRQEPRRACQIRVEKTRETLLLRNPRG